MSVKKRGQHWSVEDVDDQPCSARTTKPESQKVKVPNILHIQHPQCCSRWCSGAARPLDVKGAARVRVLNICFFGVQIARRLRLSSTVNLKNYAWVCSCTTHSIAVIGEEAKAAVFDVK